MLGYYKGQYYEYGKLQKDNQRLLPCPALDRLAGDFSQEKKQIIRIENFQAYPKGLILFEIYCGKFWVYGSHTKNSFS